jgi:hypothetical protein
MVPFDELHILSDTHNLPIISPQPFLLHDLLFLRLFRLSWKLRQGRRVPRNGRNPSDALEVRRDFIGLREGEGALGWCVQGVGLFAVARWRRGQEALRPVELVVW